MSTGLLSWKRMHRAAVLLLHLSVVGLAPLADALASETSSEARLVHVESGRRGSCAPTHDHLFCQICRVIGHAALAGDGSLRHPPRQSRFLAPRAAVESVIPRRPPAPALGSRAPPLL